MLKNTYGGVIIIYIAIGRHRLGEKEKLVKYLNYISTEIRYMYAKFVTGVVFPKYKPIKYKSFRPFRIYPLVLQCHLLQGNLPERSQ